MFPRFYKNLLNSIKINLALVLEINEDIIQINNDKNIKLLN